MEKGGIIDLLKETAAKSESNKIKVGAVITKAGIPVAQGWNQAPTGYLLEDEAGETIQEHAQHAEVMAIATSGLKDYTGCTMWITIPPCFRCASLMKTLNFEKIHYLNNYNGSTVYNLEENNLNLTITKVE